MNYQVSNFYMEIIRAMLSRSIIVDKLATKILYTNSSELEELTNTNEMHVELLNQSFNATLR